MNARKLQFVDLLTYLLPSFCAFAENWNSKRFYMEYDEQEVFYKLSTSVEISS